jgi:hypothetical protein
MNVSVYIHNKTNMCQLAAILMLNSQALSANALMILLRTVGNKE